MAHREGSYGEKGSSVMNTRSSPIPDRCRYVLANIGPEAMVQIVVRRQRRPKTETVRIKLAHGTVTGRVIGPISTFPGSYMVDVRADALLIAFTGQS